MFKDYIKQSISDIIKELNDFGTDGMLKKSFDSMHSEIYKVASDVCNNVIKPVSFAILGLFAVIELVKISSKVNESGGGNSMSAELVFKLLFKFAISVFIVNKTDMIMYAIYSLSLKIMNGVTLTTQSTAVVADIESYVNPLGLGEQIGLLMELSIIGISIKIILGLINIIALGRAIQLYLYFAVSPLPLATLTNEESSQIAKNFLKNFAAICLQGLFILLTVSFFKGLINQEITTAIDGSAGLWAILLQCILLAILVFGSQKLAKSICNAM